MTEYYFKPCLIILLLTQKQSLSPVYVCMYVHVCVCDFEGCHNGVTPMRNSALNKIYDSPSVQLDVHLEVLLVIACKVVQDDRIVSSLYRRLKRRENRGHYQQQHEVEVVNVTGRLKYRAEEFHSKTRLANVVA